MVELVLIGYLGADAQSVNSNGKTFYSFKVCDNRKVGDKEESQWYGCTLNKCSDKLLSCLKKGQLVYLRGLPRYRMYDSSVHRCKMIAVDVMVNDIQLLGSKPADEGEDTSDKGNDDAVVF